MIRFRTWHGLLAATLASLLGVLVSVGGAEKLNSSPNTVQIGLVASLFREVPEAAVQAMLQPVAVLMAAQTGVSGKLRPAGQACELAQQLAEEKLHLGVFHGIEFAWVRNKYPELRPLCIAVNQQRHLRAYLVVRRDDNASSLEDLREHSVALPLNGREHCLIFLQRRCLNCGQDYRTFFSRITTPSNVEDALDDVVEGMVRATVMDGVTLDCYKRRKPGRFNRLKTIQESEIFPAAVIVYRPGVLSDATLQRFKQGMFAANQSLSGRHLLTLWRLTAFEPVPDDYEQTLIEIARAYPAP